MMTESYIDEKSISEFDQDQLRYVDDLRMADGICWTLAELVLKQYSGNMLLT